jgi:hypothetical protein
MPRTIIDKVFEVRCKCDRCGREHVRQSDGDVSVPAGWSFLHVSVFLNQREGPLLCQSCVAFVLVAAAPAQLQLEK